MITKFLNCVDKTFVAKQMPRRLSILVFSFIYLRERQVEKKEVEHSFL